MSVYLHSVQNAEHHFVCRVVACHTDEMGAGAQFRRRFGRYSHPFREFAAEFFAFLFRRCGVEQVPATVTNRFSRLDSPAKVRLKGLEVAVCGRSGSLVDRTRLSTRGNSRYDVK